MQVEDEVRRLAETLRSAISRDLGVELDYDRAAVEWLDGYIERTHRHFGEDEVKGLTNSMGAFLGECIIANYGGVWRKSENGELGIYFNSGDSAFPFAKVEKELRNGCIDSILSFYEVIPFIFDGRVKQKASE